MTTLRRLFASVLAVALAAVLSGCCSTCIKDPPCCQKPKPPAAEKAK